MNTFMLVLLLMGVGFVFIGLILGTRTTDDGFTSAALVFIGLMVLIIDLVVWVLDLFFGGG